ncbi:MAG: hypothetical protein QNJ20_13305 [Paracoccaceae bacterium]|nr:hypothetical protein [Paracoccaceae bacterium]
MKASDRLSYIFVAAFILLWIAGPLTQLLFIMKPSLHQSWGLSSPIMLDPEFGWHKADELAIAWADMTYLVAGAVFVIGAMMRRSWAIPFGLYTSAAWSFILLLAMIRWPLLEANGFGVISGDQKIAFYAYAIVYVVFGWFSMVYLWVNRNVYAP